MKESSGDDQTLRMLLGANIMAKRKEKKMTQEEFADFLGIEQNSLSRMEKGQIAPKLSRLQCIAKGLNCDVADLFRVSAKQISDDTQEKAYAIAEILETLPPDLQDVLLDFVEKTATILAKNNKDKE